MEKVLLVIDGVAPDRKAFNSALALCLRNHAELRVLQIIRHQKLADGFKMVCNKMKCVRHYIEGSMTAAAFAEAGENKTADALLTEAMANISKLLPESEKAGVPYHVTMKTGNLREEIVKYVRAHKDVVIAVYDAPLESNQTGRRQEKNFLQAIAKALPVPLVLVQSDA